MPRNFATRASFSWIEREAFGIRSDFPRPGALGGGDTDAGSEADLPAAALGRSPCFGLAFRERTGWLSGMGSGGASRACRSARLITPSVSARLRQTVEDSVPMLNGFPPLPFTPTAVEALIMSRQAMPRRSAASNQCICPATSCESFLCPPPGRWKSWSSQQGCGSKEVKDLRRQLPIRTASISDARLLGRKRHGRPGIQSGRQRWERPGWQQTRRPEHYRMTAAA
jgi:hypothetical protein